MLVFQNQVPKTSCEKVLRFALQKLTIVFTVPFHLIEQSNSANIFVEFGTSAYESSHELRGTLGPLQTRYNRSGGRVV